MSDRGNGKRAGNGAMVTPDGIRKSVIKIRGIQWTCRELSTKGRKTPIQQYRRVRELIGGYVSRDGNTAL